MRTLRLAALLALTLPCAAHAEDVSLDGGNVTLTLPESLGMKESKEGKNARSLYKSANKDATLTLACGTESTGNKAFTVEQVQQVMLASRKAMPAELDPGKHTYVADEIRDIRDTRWYYSERSSEMKDGDRHQIGLMTPYAGNRIFVCTYNALENVFKENEAALRESVASIEVQKNED